ncbi:MAG: hypothetical protein M0R46_16935 [Candidatus Muirbacterium halophilum]|nr:hypothetical protein [Candidatus Muirbacterium halophilum]
MFRKKTTKNETIVIDLDGPDGNAFVLIAAAGQLGNELGFDQEKITEITEEMKSGDYVELIRVFDKYFGDFVILESNNIDDYV